jgi:putative transposase
MHMPYDSVIHHRRSIRLPGYDYAQAGWYFITICTQHRKCLFGDIVDGQVWLNASGKMVQAVWCAIPLHYEGINIDTFVIMPNHLHGIMIIENNEKDGTAPVVDIGLARGLSLPDVVQRFKTLTTKKYTDGVKRSGWSPFPGRLWQRNYWERIIRNEPELDRIREYIQTNPACWDEDQLYVDSSVVGP